MLSIFKFLRLLILFFLFAGSVDVMAALAWKQTSLKKTVDVRQGTMVFKFRFQNTGSEVVTIDELKSSCSCFSPKTEKMKYAAGESGVISVLVDLNGRSGRLDKSLSVVTSAGTYSLGLDLRIPEGYQLSSRRLKWDDGESDEKSCSLINKNLKPIILETDFSRPEFKVELEEVRKGFEYKLKVLPLDCTEKIRNTIIIKTEPFGDSGPREYKVYIFVPISHPLYSKVVYCCHDTL